MVQEAPDTVILAEDEAGLYLQATTMRVWSSVGQTPTVRVHIGRQQTHFYGSLNLLTNTEIVMQAETLNSETTATYLQLIADTIPDKPILLLWDGATWHGGPAVAAFLEQNPRFTVMRFPPGSPDLNPQEHVWKLTREQVSHNHIQKSLQQLATDFKAHLTSTTFQCSFLERYGYSAIRPMFI